MVPHGLDAEIVRFGDWIRAQGKSEATVGNNVGYCRSFLRFGVGNIEGFGLGSCNSQALKAFAQHMRDKGYRSKTIRSEVAGALAWFKWLAKTNKIASADGLPGLSVTDILGAASKT